MQTSKSLKIRRAGWWAIRPWRYPEASRKVRRRIRRSWAQRRMRLASDWCRQLMVDPSSAIKQVTGRSPTDGLDDRFGDVLRQAVLRTATAPGRMGGPANLQLLFELAEYAGANRIVETGVALGWSSLALLLSLRNRPDSRLISTDRPYPGEDLSSYVGLAVSPELRANWEIIRKPDVEALPQALSQIGQIDMCHYDSDKSAKGRSWAYKLLWEALRDGGVFVSDDVGDNFAFRDFCQRIEQKPIIVGSDHEKWGDKFVGIVVKTPNQQD